VEEERPADTPGHYRSYCDMKNLITAARAVVDKWESGDLAAAVRALSAALPEGSEPVIAAPEQIAAAKDFTGWSDDLKFDEAAEISHADGGHWISCWQWIPEEEEN